MLAGVAARLRRLWGGGPPESLIPAPYLALSRKLLQEALARCDGGDVIEIGVYKGGSLYRLAEAIASAGRSDFGPRRLIGIDTFAGHPYSDPQRDPAHHPKGRFADASFEEVSSALRRFPFAVVLKGECGEVFAGLPAAQTFCFAHVDVDVYQGAVACVDYLYPRLRPGGVMVFDEYAGYGQKEYIDRYFAGKPVELAPRAGRERDDYGLIVRRLS